MSAQNEATTQFESQRRDIFIYILAGAVTISTGKIEVNASIESFQL
jgi:hypothetical protein